MIAKKRKKRKSMCHQKQKAQCQDWITGSATHIIAVKLVGLFLAKKLGAILSKGNDKRGYSVCGHQLPCHRLTDAFVRCNHPAGPKALIK
jgi:hypothetical protein